MQTRAQRVAAAMLLGAAALLPLQSFAATPLPNAPSTYYPWAAPAQFSVAPNGSPLYRIPIAVPPAPVAPQLELAYSGRGNGLVGLGWSLRGLSVITRCPKTTAQDGVRGAVRFNSNDRFCLDGQKLILVKGTYGANGAEYRTEQDSFTKIISYGASGSGPAYFKAWTKSGLLMDFGSPGTPAYVAYVETLQIPGMPASTWARNTIREWPVSAMTDPRGRTLSVNYQNDDNLTGYPSGSGGFYHPVSIGYGGNANTGTAGDLSVSFGYEVMPNPMARYMGGAGLMQINRLKSITTYSSASAVATVTLSYASVGSAQMSRLASAITCPGTSSSGSACLPPVSFGYSTATGGFASGASWALPSGAVSPVVGVQTQQQVYTYNDTTQYGTPSSPASRAQTQISLVDLNGDGLPDLYVTGYTPPSGSNPEVIAPGQVFLNTGTGFSSSATAWSLPSGVKVQKDVVNGNTYSALIDMNGDGLPDLYQTVNGTSVVYLNTGTGFSSTATPWSLPSGFTNQNAVVTSTPNATETFVDTQYSLTDIDGDGLPDAILSTAGNGSLVYLGTPSGFSATSTNWLSAYTTVNRLVSFNDNFEFGTSSAPLKRTQTQIALVDLNGDGLPDLYITRYDPPGVSGGSGTTYPAQVFLNTGNGFFTQAVANGWTLPTGIKAQKDVVNGYTVVMLVDVNGDGLPDLYHTVGPLNSSNPRGEVFLNTGTGFASTSIPWTLPVQAPTQNVLAANGTTQASLIDLDGDGLPDSFVTDGTNPTQAFLGTSAPLARLSQVSSLTQPTLNLSWSKLTDPTVYTVDSGSNAAAYPWVDIRAGKAVVASVAVDNGVGGTATVNYTYGGLKTELGLGRGPLGFRWMDAKDTTTGLETYTQFRQDYPYTGLVAKSEARLAGSGSGGVLKRTTNTFACQLSQTLAACSVAPGNIYFPYVSSALDESWDLNGFTFPTLTTASTYGQSPQYGAPTQVTVTNSDGSSKSTAYQYATPDTTNWILNRVTRATVTSTKP